VAVDAARYAGRRGRQHDQRAKERRQKQILAAGTALLAVLLAIQLPRTLHRAHGASPVRAEAAPAVQVQPADASPAPSAARPLSARQAALVRTFDPKDPFATQQGRAGVTNAATTQTTGPPVRSSHFLAKDPFVQQPDGGATTAGPTPAKGPRVRSSHFLAKDLFAVQRPGSGPAVKAPTRVAERVRGQRYVVVLASIPVPNGHGAAAHVAGIARARGIRGAGVLSSSAYRTLRPGFYVVYGSTYPNANAALRALVAARAHGFPTAYTRPLAR
jgi:hypothetical protein